MGARQNIVTPYRMTVGRAEKAVREIAEDTSNIIWTDHALERCEERDITDMDALRVLRKGSIEGEPEVGRRHGEWTCKIVHKARSNRSIGVVTVLMTKDRKLRIVTVEWEDLK